MKTDTGKMEMNTVSTATTRDREFVLTQDEFKKLTSLVREVTGIVLGDQKMEMLYGRLARRLRILKLSSFSEYCALLDSDQASEEIDFLTNAVTTNLTKFYRESHHFDFLSEHLTSIQRNPGTHHSGKKMRIWSAGCSSGEEPYSIASVIHKKHAPLLSWDLKILATDLDTNILDKGSKGIYKKAAIEDIPDDYKSSFDDITSLKGDEVHIRDKAKKLIHFKRLNLLHPWPMRMKYDVIFCRNVLIYFDTQTKESLVHRYAELLAPGGMLFLGHSESLTTKIPGLKLIGRTAYRKDGGNQ